MDRNPGRIMIQQALLYARDNFRVFPLHTFNKDGCTCGRADCSSAGKHPRTKNGVKDATTDEQQIRQWWTRWPMANIGIATGNGLYVIDVDCAKGGNYESLAELGIKGLLWTRTVATGSGGYHFYLRCEEPLPNTAGKLGPYIDTRCEGGYVVAPPSRNSHGGYVWHSSREMQYLPERAIVRLKASKSPSAGPQIWYPQRTGEKEITGTLSSQEVVASAPQPVEPSNSLVTRTNAQVARNNFLISMAGRWRGYGFDAPTICALIATLNEHLYGGGKHPQGPLSREELERTIFKSVVKWDQECGTLPLSLPPNADSLTNLLSCELPDPSWLVPELISEGLVLLAGKPKLGKSWLALSLALDCALGTACQGKLALGRYTVAKAGVLYLSLEDSQKRFQSRVMKLLNGRPTPENFAYLLTWKPLQGDGLLDLDTLLYTASDTRLVVIDTLARVRQPGKSGSNVYQDDYELMARLHEFAIRHHITLLLVHHTRKLGSDDPFDEISGSTGLTGAADTSMVLKRERNQPNATLHITGRDVEEQELALIFDSSTCTWSVTGTAAEREVSQSRKEVLNLLKQNGPMTPMDIAKELGKGSATIKSTLRRMVEDGEIARQGRGQYALPQ